MEKVSFESGVEQRSDA